MMLNYHIFSSKIIIQTIMIMMTLYGLDIFGKESERRVNKEQYTLSISAVINHETAPITEWIEYHRLIGVDHFYLYYSGKSKLVKQSLKRYIQSGVVTFIPWLEQSEIIEELDPVSWTLAVKIPAFENAIYVRAIYKTKWLIFLEVNEYLVPVKASSVVDILKKYNKHPGVILSTDCFNASKVDRIPPTQLLIENIELVAAPHKIDCRESEKQIVNPSACRGCCAPPYQCLFKDDCQPIEISRTELRINRYINHERPYLENLKKRFNGNHRNLTQNDLSVLLKQGYAVEDQEKAIGRFVPLLRKKLGLEKP